MDIFPTAVDLSGLPVPVNLDGKSLLPLLREETCEHHGFLAWAQNCSKWVIRKGKWKLTHNVPWNHRDFKVLANGDVAGTLANLTLSWRNPTLRPRSGHR